MTPKYFVTDFGCNVSLLGLINKLKFLSFVIEIINKILPWFNDRPCSIPYEFIFWTAKIVSPSIMPTNKPTTPSVRDLRNL